MVTIELHPQVRPLAFLLGTWEGAGVADFPGAEKCNFGQEVTFTHDGRDFLEYHSHSWVLDGEGKKVRPLETETGYWRIDKDRKVEVVMIRDQGVAEVWYGEHADQKRGAGAVHGAREHVAPLEVVPEPGARARRREAAVQRAVRRIGMGEQPGRDRDGEHEHQDRE